MFFLWFFQAPRLELRKLAETSNTVTLGWDPVPGAIGYRFSSTQNLDKPHTWDPLFQRVKSLPACNTIFGKTDSYTVEALCVSEKDSYP